MVPWRSDNIKYPTNEVFLDVVESVNTLVHYTPVLLLLLLLLVGVETYDVCMIGGKQWVCFAIGGDRKDSYQLTLERYAQFEIGPQRQVICFHEFCYSWN